MLRILSSGNGIITLLITTSLFDIESKIRELN